MLLFLIAGCVGSGQAPPGAGYDRLDFNRPNWDHLDDYAQAKDPDLSSVAKD